MIFYLGFYRSKFRLSEPAFSDSGTKIINKAEAKSFLANLFNYFSSN
jgi:hypothetical protein